MPESILPRCQRRVRECACRIATATFVVKWQGALDGAGRLEVLLLCASSGRRVRKRDVRLLSSDRGRGFPTRRVELAGLACTVLHSLMVRCARRRRGPKGEKSKGDAREARKERAKTE